MKVTIAEFQEVITENKIKFTKPQQKIVDKLLRGDKLVVVNQYRINGGEFMWKDHNSSYLSYAGSVYKAFFNIFYQIKKQTGFTTDINPNNFMISNYKEEI